jgi:hypothetical protein
MTKLRSAPRLILQPGTLLIPFALSTTAGACSNNPSDPTKEVTGSFIVVSYDAKPLPATISRDNFRTIELLESQVMLRGDGTYNEQITIRTTEAGKSSQNSTTLSNGSYRVQGNQVDLTSVAGVTWHLTVEDSETLRGSTDLGLAIIYKKGVVISKSGSRPASGRATRDRA